jgi:hypothetical protein
MSRGELDVARHKTVQMNLAKKKASAPKVVTVDLSDLLAKHAVSRSGMTVKMANGVRALGTTRLLMATNYLADVWWNNAGSPGMALGTNGQYPLRPGLGQMAAAPKYGYAIEANALDDLADLIPMGVLALVETRMDATKLKYCKSLSKSNAVETLAHALAPCTEAVLQDKQAALMRIKLPSICFELADLFTTPIQCWAGTPGSAYPSLYFLPIGCKALSGGDGGTFDTLIGNIGAKVAAMQAVNALGMNDLVRTVRLIDILPKEPVSMHSTLGYLWAHHCPISFKSAGGAVSQSTHAFLAASDVYVSEHFGMDGLTDLSVIASTSHSGRTNDIWESLTCYAPVNNSDMGLVKADEDATDFTVITDSEKHGDFLNLVADGRSVTWTLLSSYLPFVLYLNDPNTEAEWNYKAADICLQSLQGKRLITRGLPLLPDIKNVSMYQELILANAANPVAAPLGRPDARQSKDVASYNSLNQASMSAGGQPEGKTNSRERISQGEGYDTAGSGSSDERPRRRG